jgi:hypothetical protein
MINWYCRSKVRKMISQVKLISAFIKKLTEMIYPDDVKVHPYSF